MSEFALPTQAEVEKPAAKSPDKSVRRFIMAPLRRVAEGIRSAIGFSK